MNEPLAIFDEVQRSLPILTSKSAKAASVRPGSVCATLSIVSSCNRVFLVTANHVLRIFSKTVLTSPLLKCGGMVELRQYEWVHLNAGTSISEKDGLLDLAVAELNQEQISEIDKSVIVPLGRALRITRPFKAVLFGYRGKGNSEHDIARNGVPKAHYYEVGVRDLYSQNSHFHFKFEFDRKTAELLSETGVDTAGYTAPIPSGLSGCPLIYCGSKFDSIYEVPLHSAVGIFLKQCDRRKNAIAVGLDVIFNSFNIQQ